VVDADQIAREIVEPGMPALGAVVERFGAGVLDTEGRLDRAALAEIAFADAAARADLNAITHPAVAAAILERVQKWQGTGRIVVLDIPLLNAKSIGSYGLDVVVVVDAPVEVAVERLVRRRRFTESDARARVAAQIGRDERRAFADLIVDNAGSTEDLEAEVDRVWTDLVRRAGAVG
jgi:dephospho-CoA kinase